MLVILLASTFNTYNKCISLQYEKIVSTQHPRRVQRSYCPGALVLNNSFEADFYCSMNECSLTVLALLNSSGAIWSRAMYTEYFFLNIWSNCLEQCTWLTYMWKCWLTVASKIIASLEYDLLPMANWENKQIKIVK